MINEKKVTPEEAKEFAIAGAISLAKMGAVLYVKETDPNRRSALSIMVDHALTLGEALVLETIPTFSEGLSLEEKNELTGDRATLAVIDTLTDMFNESI